VRRVFAILVKQRRVLEWRRDIDNWQTLSDAASIDDRCLVRPLAIRALPDAAAVEDEAARALLMRDNPVIARALAESKAVAEARVLRDGKDADKLIAAAKRSGTPFAMIDSGYGVENVRAALESAFEATGS